MQERDTVKDHASNREGGLPVLADLRGAPRVGRGLGRSAMRAGKLGSEGGGPEAVWVIE